MFKIKCLCGVSLALSLTSLYVSGSNFNGALSDQYRAVSSMKFYGTLGLPVVLSGIALLLGVYAYFALKVASSSVNTEIQNEADEQKK